MERPHSRLVPTCSRVPAGRHPHPRDERGSESVGTPGRGGRPPEREERRSSASDSGVAMGMYLECDVVRPPGSQPRGLSRKGGARVDPALARPRPRRDAPPEPFDPRPRQPLLRDVSADVWLGGDAIPTCPVRTRALGPRRSLLVGHGSGCASSATRQGVPTPSARPHGDRARAATSCCRSRLARV